MFCFVGVFWFWFFGWFFYPLSNFRKSSLVWAKEESKTHVLKLFRTLMEKDMLESDMKNCLVIVAVSVKELLLE